MEKIGMGIKAVYRMTISLVAAATLSILFIMSLISTCYLTSEEYEITFFCKDNYLLNIMLLIGSVTLLLFLKKLKLWRKFSGWLVVDSNFLRIKTILLGLLLASCLTWVFMTQFVPGSDQLDVMSSAYKLRHYDYSMLQAGGYLDLWPNQIGLSLIEYYFGCVFGDYNVIGFQLMNCFGVVLLYKKLVDVMDLFETSRLSQVITLICGILFLPFIIYTSFVYGTIWSIALAVFAFDSEVRFLRTHSLVRVLLSIIAIGFGFQVKNNVLIIFIAMIIYGLVMSLKDKASILRGLAFVLSLSLSMLVFEWTPKAILESKTGYTLNQGVSSWAFIAMGLQDEQHAPGWSNGYNYETYYASNCITEIQAEKAKNDISDRVAVFKDNSHYAFEFFSQKIASMWTEPTYQSFWISQIRKHRVDFPAWLEQFMGATGYSIASTALGFYQLLLFFGCLMWLLLVEKKNFVEQSFFMLCIIGGFIFHMFWEAKSQYSITYVVLMIPMAVLGLEMLIKKLEKRNIDVLEDKSVRIKKVMEHSYVAVICIVVIAGYLAIYAIDGTHCLTYDDGYYELYLNQIVMPDNSESVLEINILRAEKEYYKNRTEVFEQVIIENGLEW